MVVDHEGSRHFSPMLVNDEVYGWVSRRHLAMHKACFDRTPEVEITGRHRLSCSTHVIASSGGVRHLYQAGSTRLGVEVGVTHPE
jgi:hypothetical protein